MFEHGAWRLMAFLIFFSVGRTHCSSDKPRDEYNSKCKFLQVRNSTDKIADRAGKISNSTKKQYVVESSDYEDVSDFEKDKTESFNFFSFFTGREFHLEKIVINKCCSLNSYFDLNTFNCFESSKGFHNPSHTEFIAASGINNYENFSNYEVVESVPNCGNRSVLSIQITSRIEISESRIVVNEKIFSKYCIDENPNYPNTTIVLTCQDSDDFCRNHSCFRKCCPLMESYGLSGRRCQKTNNPFRPEFFDLPSLAPDTSISLSQFGLFLGDSCGSKGKYLLEKEEGELSYLDVTGSLYVPMYKKCFAKDDFCLEYVQLENFSGIGSFLCFPDTSAQFENSELQYLLLSLGLIISCTFLLLTFLVYLFSSKSRNLYGKTLMCYIVCLFSAYVCLAAVELKSTDLDRNLCISMGYAILFSFLGAFFWLNVISFDIWKTFRADRSIERSKKDRSKRIRFLWYSLYAWTFPCLITAACAVVNQLPNFPYESIKPNIGKDNCWFSRHTKGIYIFFIAPTSIIITCNVFFYIQTAWKIWKVKSDVAKMGKQKQKKFTTNKDQFLINGKLFIIMGITWSLEIVSFFAPHPIWYVTDTANALHGVFIFAIFVLKRKVFRNISQHIRSPLKTLKQLSTSTPTSDSARSKQNSTVRGKSPAVTEVPISTVTEKKF